MAEEGVGTVAESGGMCWDGEEEGVEDGFVRVVASGLSNSVGFCTEIVFLTLLFVASARTLFPSLSLLLSLSLSRARARSLSSSHFLSWRPLAIVSLSSASSIPHPPLTSILLLKDTDSPQVSSSSIGHKYPPPQ